MNNNLEIFNYENNEVRTVNKDNNVWFVLKDVCDVLEIKNATDVAKRLDEDEVTRFNLGGLSGETNIINESGLYNVILRSDKPNAKQFKRWITHEVLPAIRKTGGYVANDEMFINTYLPFADELTKQLFANTLKTVREQNTLILEMKPKADYFDNLVERNLLTNLRDTAKEIGVAPKRFNNYLLENGFLYRDSKQKLKPYQTKVEQGLFELKEFVNQYNGHSDNQTLVTPKGRETFRLLVSEIVGNVAERSNV